MFVLSGLSGLFCEDFDLWCFVAQSTDDTNRIRSIKTFTKYKKCYCRQIYHVLNAETTMTKEKKTRQIVKSKVPGIS